MAYLMLPDALMPEHIARWQRGAGGEQKTARALKPLRKEGWLIRHDLATGYGNSNRDHIAAGPAVRLGRAPVRRPCGAADETERPRL